MKIYLLVIHALCLLCSAFTLKAVEGIPAEALFKQPDVFSMSLSPQGKYLLEVGRNETQRFLNIIDSTSLKKYRIDTQEIEKAAIVTDFSWLDEATLYIEYKKQRATYFGKSVSNAYIIKIDESNSPFTVAWHRILTNGYVLSKRIAEDGKVIFAKNEGDYGEFYRLYRVSIDDLLADRLGVSNKYRLGLSEARYFFYDANNDILIGHTYDDGEVDIWYLPSGKLFWSRVYSHDVEDEFVPLGFINDNTLAVLTDKDANFTYLAEFNLENQSFGEVLYQHAAHDLTDATFAKNGVLESISYIQHGVVNIEYISLDARKAKDKLAQQIPDSNVAVIGESENSDIKLALTHASDTPGELYLYKQSSNSLRSLGMLRKNLDEYTLARAEVFTVTADDGVEIEGIVTKPPLESNGVLLVISHGWPVGVRDYADFNLSNQFYASRGYTILNVNFRGSSGFGKNFKDQGRGQFGQLIEQDIMAVYRNFTQKHSFEHACAIGGSYGGYSAMMLAIKHPKSFQCVISLFGVFDLPHLFNATNFRTQPESQEGIAKVVGDNSSALNEISPVRLAHKIQVPVLIMAGEDDPIAPFEQSNRMKYVLEKLGKPVEFHMYKNTEHGHDNYLGDQHEHKAVHRFIEYSRTNLFQIRKAFKNKTLAEIEVIIKQLTDIDVQDGKGYSLAHYVVELQDEIKAVKILSLLAKYQGDIDLVSLSENTPLYIAVDLNKALVVKKLLSLGADVNTQNPNEWTPLFLAASEGYVEVVRELLKYNIDFNHIHPKGWTALMFTTNAFEKYDGGKQAQIAKMILDKNENVNIEARTTRGLTVLMNAAFNDKYEIVKLLIDAGADVHAINQKEKHKTALDYAKEQKNNEIEEYLSDIEERTPKADTTLFKALIEKLKDNNLEGAETLIQKLPDINAFDKKGNSAMHYAVTLKNEDHAINIARKLLEHGADINQRNGRHISPLYLAATSKLTRNKIVKFMLENSANVNQVKQLGWSPLTIAISKGKVEIVRMMMGYNPNFKIKTIKHGWLAFMHITNNKYDEAKDESQAEIGRILLKNGADIEGRTRSGRTPLMNAAENGKLAVVKMLVESGADLQAINEKDGNKTPLDYATKKQYSEIIVYLKSASLVS